MLKEKTLEIGEGIRRDGKSSLRQQSEKKQNT
jgi:hypothetical protein